MKLINQLLSLEGGRKQLVYTPVPNPVKLIFLITVERGNPSQYKCTIKCENRDELIMTAKKTKKAKNITVMLEDSEKMGKNSSSSSYLGKIEKY